MKLFDIFRRKVDDEVDEEFEKKGIKIKFGRHDEGLVYQQAGKEIYVGFTWIKGNTIYPDEIKKWGDGSKLTEQEQEQVFLDLINFVGRKKGKPTVIINIDDRSKSLWEYLCKSNNQLIEKIEYTSDEEDVQYNRKISLEALKSGGKIKRYIDGVEINNEEDMERALASYIKKKREQLDN